MTNVTVLRNKFFNDNLAEKMLRARRNQETMMKDLSPKYQAVQDFNKGLSIDENRFPENSEEWKEYNIVWRDCYMIELYAEQEVTCP